MHLRASDVYAQSQVRSRTTLAILQRSLEALNATRGRKSLILVSAGFIWDSNLEEFKWVARAARRANAAIYFVNAEGLKGLPFQMTAEFGAALQEMDLGAPSPRTSGTRRGRSRSPPKAEASPSATPTTSPPD